MTLIDWIAVAVIVLVALNGLRLGFIGGVFSLAGVAAGAYLGAKLAPQVLGGGDSLYTPLVALGGAVLLGTLLQSVASMGGQAIRRALFTLPPLRALDSVAGLVLGAVAGTAIVWVAGAVALHIPGQTDLRQDVQSSRILSEINERVPPSRLLDAIARVDPFSAIRGPQARVGPPDPKLLRDPGVAAARGSVLRVTGTACGLGIEGSGWAARPNLVVTNAHVVAGTKDTRVDRSDGDFRKARVVFLDPKNDVAILRVAGLNARPLELTQPGEGDPVAILGYPENGPFTATAGRIGQTGTVLTADAYGRGPVRRPVTTLRGRVRHGNSGGPAVDRSGRVQTTIFAARLGSESGYGVPTSVVREALDNVAPRAISTGPCVG